MFVLNSVIAKNLFKMIKIACLVFLISSGMAGCDGKPASKTTSSDPDSIKSNEILTTPGYTFPYRLDQPDETFKLTNSLQEISGLGISDSGDFLYAVQDEQGYIFKLYKKSAEVVEKIRFHKNGDYEGVEVVKDEIYVVKSTGTIYQVTNPGMEDQKLTKFNDFLGRENDVEGLAYDKKNNRLLVACKGVPSTGESFETIRHKKVIYSFDLSTNTLIKEPVYTIQLDDIRKYLEQNKTLKKYEKLVEFFSGGKENLTFNPSAIAVHPLTGNIYVTSSSGKVLIVLTEAGKIIYIEKLDKDVHLQPEGLVFEKDGTLYISNEGRGAKSRIHRFNRK